MHYILNDTNDIGTYNLEEEISKHLRRSRPFTINEDNSYSKENFLFAVSEKGIVLCSYDKNEKQGKTRNSRFLTLCLLAIAYNIKMEKYLEDGAKIYKNYIDKKEENSLEGISEIIEFRESIYAFDLQYFFENPVKIDKYESYIVWSIISKCYKVMVRHEEVKNQVLSLTEIIVKNKDQELQKYEKEKELQMEKANKIEKSFQNRISLIGLFVAVVPIVITLIDSVEILKKHNTLMLILLLLLCVATFFVMYINSKIKKKKIKAINKDL